MTRNIQFITDSFYHIYNRGVRKSDIFINNQDYNRWEQILYWCNNYEYSYSRYLFRLFQIKKKGGSIEKLNELVNTYKLDKPLVEIHAFVEMPNHFHLLVRQVTDNAIPRFMQKLSTAYSMYLNLQLGFKGAVFEGSYCVVEVLSDSQLLQLFRYIHINPLIAGLIASGKLLDYPWSSLPDYCSNSDNKIIIKDYFLGALGNSKKLYDFIISSVSDDNKEILREVVMDDDFRWFV